ncbi:MAG: GAF domain-containing protein [Bacteroidales bacterium]|jgi:GAF domain-containing protein|nr:GAF domain-containing protein [Bacteroidales bacterium]
MTEKTKRERYHRIYSQIESLISKTSNLNARMATAIAVLHHKMDYFFWTGFYFLHQEELTVGQYQGSLACLVLKKDTGVCWFALNARKTTIVDDVNQFPGHIACDSRSQSEIVVPVWNRDKTEVIGVLDVDSEKKSSFTEVDAQELEKIVELIFMSTN